MGSTVLQSSNIVHVSMILSFGRGTFFQASGIRKISLVEEYERAGKSVHCRLWKGLKGLTDHFMAVKKERKLPGLVTYSCLQTYLQQLKGCSVLN